MLMTDDKILQQKYLELLSLSQTLDELDTVKPQSKMYAPLGGGLYVESVITETKKVLTNVGAGVVVSKTLEETKQIIEEQIDDLQNVVETVENRVQEMMKKGQQLHKEMMALSEKQPKKPKEILK